MTYPVAMIPYTNMAPYRALGPPEECRFHLCVPRRSIAALREGRVLAAAVPVGGLDAVAREAEPLGAFGIAAARRVLSVLFFSRRPFREMDGTARIRLTTESASSVRLLLLLLAGPEISEDFEGRIRGNLRHGERFQLPDKNGFYRDPQPGNRLRQDRLAGDAVRIDMGDDGYIRSSRDLLRGSLHIIGKTHCIISRDVHTDELYGNETGIPGIS